jgi:outer membrane receptor protein involved in Fe transport
MPGIYLRRLKEIAAAGAPCAAFAAMLTTPATAADSTDAGAAAGLDEIVVTATRREERLQDVPISVTAFSQEKLDVQGLKNIDDLARLSPGVTFSRNGMGSSANYNDEGSDINIRGVDSTAGTSTTGVYIDDTPIQTRHIGFGSVNPFPQLFDLDRVEVLRGPQGTLFGAGAEGGVVRFIAPEPSVTKTSAYARADFSETTSGAPSYDLGAAFGAPIIDGVLGFRVSASASELGGWVDRVNYTLSPNAAVETPTPVNAGVAEANSNWQTVKTARAALKWQVTDNLEISPSVYWQELHINDTAAYWVALSNPSDNVYQNGNARDNPSTDPFTLTAIKLKWELGFAALTSNTSYLARDQHSTSDYTQYLRATWASIGYVPPASGPIPANPPAFQLPNTFPQPGDGGYAPFQDTQHNFYEEIRLASTDAASSLSWSGGLFFSHLDENVPETIVDPTLNQEVINYTQGADAICASGPAAPAALTCPNGVIFNGPVDRVIDKQIAAFGEVGFKFTDTLKATAGLRVSRLEFTGSVVESGPFLGTSITTSSSATEDPVTPKVVFSWQPDHDDLFYVSASKGFRPGGPNVGVGGICQGNLDSLGVPSVPGKFASDSLWSYELGAKNAFFDNTLQINASLFYVDWNNIQQNVYLPACGEQFTANLGKAKSEGGDIEVIYRPIQQLTFDVTAAYTDARLTKTTCAGSLTYDGTACTDASNPNVTPVAPIASKGDALLGSPWAFTASVEYHLPDWQGRKPYVRLDEQYTTAQRSLLQSQDSANALYDTTIPGLPVTENLSLRAGVRFEGFDLSLYGNNLTDAHPLLYESRDIAYSVTDTLYFGRGVRPRTFGVTAIYRY